MKIEIFASDMVGEGNKENDACLRIQAETPTDSYALRNFATQKKFFLIIDDGITPNLGIRFEAQREDERARDLAEIRFQHFAKS